MKHKLAPYQIIIRVGVLVLFICWFALQLQPDFFPELINVVSLVISVLLLFCFCLDVGRRYAEYRAGNFYLLYTGGTVLSILVALSMPIVIGIQLAVVGPANVDVTESFLLYTLCNAVGFQTYSYLYLDSVRVEHRVGTKVTVFPRYEIAEVTEDQGELLIVSGTEEKMVVTAKQLPAARYSELRTRVSALA